MRIRSFTRRDIRGMLALARKLPEWPQSSPVDLHYARGFVAVEGKSIVGFIACSSEDGVSCIRTLRVDPGRQRQGIGTQLVAAAEGDARKAGAGALRVVVMGWTRPFQRRFSDALEFYKSLGFKTVRKHPTHQEGPDRWRYYTLEKNWGETAGIRVNPQS
jgi:ribosomal protein S18 acetylase RimI-like enzyme